MVAWISNSMSMKHASIWACVLHWPFWEKTLAEIIPLFFVNSGNSHWRFLIPIRASWIFFQKTPKTGPSSLSSSPNCPYSNFTGYSFHPTRGGMFYIIYTIQTPSICVSRKNFHLQWVILHPHNRQSEIIFDCSLYILRNSENSFHQNTIIFEKEKIKNYFRIA